MIYRMTGKTIRFLVMFVFFTAAAVLPKNVLHAEGLPYSAYAPVLLYHDIKETPINGFDVTPEAFAQQLDWLKDNGYRTLSMDEYIDCIDKGAFPEKSVLITFDDGYQGIWDYAVPEIEKRDMQVTFFLIAGSIDTALPGYRNITFKELRSLAKNPHVSIGSHTVSHPLDLRLGSYYENFSEFKDSKHSLEIATGKPVRAVAYSCGSYDEEVIIAAQRAGYEAAFTVENRGDMWEDTRFSIPRIYMGLAFCEDDNRLFKENVQRYAEQDDALFVEHFYWLGNEPK